MGNIFKGERFLMNSHPGKKGRAGANRSLERLLFKISRGDIQGIQRALDDGLDPNLRDSDGWTPIMHAAAYANPQILALAIERGDPLLRGPAGRNALMIATQLGRAKSVQALIPVSDLFAEDENGARASDLAAESNHMALHALLISAELAAQIPEAEEQAPRAAPRL